LGEINDKDKKYQRAYFYGIVVDACAPYKPEKFNKFLCNLKITDASLKGGDKEKKSMKLFIFGKNALDLPHITEVGSIIRIHRAFAKMHEGKLQLNCDVISKGAWCLFALNPPNDSSKYNPISFSKKTFSFTAGDKKILDEMRGTANHLLKQAALYEKSLSFTEAEKKKKDFDVICAVLSKKKDKESKGIKVKLCDHTKLVKMKIPSKIAEKYSFEANSCVRIRCCNYDEKSMNKLILEEHSNIITVSEQSKVAQDLMKKIKETKNKEVLINAKIHLFYLDEYNIAKVGEEGKGKKVSSLKNVIEDSKNYPSGKAYVVKVSPVNITPLKEKEWKSGKGKKGEGYNFQIECKDLSNWEDDKTYSLEVSPDESKGFIGSNIKGEGKECIKKLKLIKKMLLKTNCVMEVAVLKTGKTLVIKGSKLDIDL